MRNEVIRKKAQPDYKEAHTDQNTWETVHKNNQNTQKDDVQDNPKWSVELKPLQKLSSNCKLLYRNPCLPNNKGL